MNIVDKQIEAYNKRDLEAFLDCYAENIEVLMFESNQMLTKGKEQLRQTMSESFASKTDSKTIVISRISHNKLIIEIEEITGHIEGQVITSVSIYEITENKISKLWFGGRSVEPVKD